MKKPHVSVLAAVFVFISAMLVRPAIALRAGSTADTTVMVTVPAEIKGKVDTKDAKTGDTITAKTLNAVKLGDSTLIPKGSILSGKVVHVCSRAAGNGTASLDVLFNQVQPGKKAAPVTVHGLLIAIAPRPSLSDAGPSTSDLPMVGAEQGIALAAAGTSSSSEVYSVKHTGDNAGIPMGSSLHGVALAGANDTAPGRLTSSKEDIKLESGMRIGVRMIYNK